MRTKQVQSLVSELFLFALLLMAWPGALQAQFSCTTNGGAITITGYTGPGGAVDIPSTINGWPVTAIKYSAFEYQTGLTSVTVPNSVTSIGYTAFQWCSSLATVTVGSGVTSLGNATFLGCASLAAITVDAANPAYRSVDGILFEKDLSTLIQYPPAKAGSCMVPWTITNIEAFALAGCAALSAIVVDSANPAYSSEDGVLFDKSQTTLIQCPGGKAGHYAVPVGVAALGDWAFAYCTRLASVTIPSSVTGIWDEAFNNCYALTGVYFQGHAPGMIDRRPPSLIHALAATASIPPEVWN